MRIIDNIPEVVYAAREEIMQTDLTEKVWGESGRGNTTLTTKLFPFMVDRGYLTMRTRGRAKIFQATSKGIAQMEKMCGDRGYPVITD